MNAWDLTVPATSPTGPAVLRWGLVTPFLPALAAAEAQVVIE